MASIESSAYTAVSENETGSPPGSASANAYQLSPPSSPTSGWSIGPAQLDFHGQPGEAQLLLESALEAAGDPPEFSVSVAEKITAFGEGGSQTQNECEATLNASLVSNGTLVAEIDKTLQAPAAKQVINTQSSQDFSEMFSERRVQCLGIAPPVPDYRCSMLMLTNKRVS